MYHRRKHSLLAILLVMGLFCGLASAYDVASDPDLLAWWDCDEGAGTAVADASGNGHDGTFVNGDPVWTEGIRGSAVELTGPTLVEIPALGITLSEATFAGWMLPYGSQPDWSSFIMHRPVATGFNILGFQLAYHWNDTGASYNFRGGDTIPDNEWTFAAVSVFPDRAVFYVNGEEGATNTVAHAPATFDQNLYLGGDGDASWVGRRMVGALDDIAFFGRALTGDEIMAVMDGLSAPGPASSPDPINEANDIPRELLLSWDAGIFAQTHDVYLGTSWDDVNSATVDNPLGVLQSAGQAETTFAPDTLGFETTYFWRVDEVNAPPDKTVFKGEVWSFTTEPVAYPIADISTTASSVHQPGMEADRTIDGSGLNANDEHSPDLAQMWLSNASETEGVWIEFDLGKVYKLDRIHVWNHNSQTESILGYGIKEALVEISTDGETWTELKTAEFAQATGSSDYTGAAVPLDSAMARYVRITALSNYSILGLKQFGFSEVRFYSIPVLAREPMPADNGTSDGADVILSWRAGRESVQHEVVFSDDMQAVADDSAVVGTVDDPSYDLGTLDLGHTYYWKINEMNDVGTPPSYQGDLWTFQTPDHAMVDDMEMYKAEQGLFIWEHWLDGFQNPDNGSIVGDGDDAETSIVYEGRQSLPMAYDNNLSPASEATRFFDSPVDLTIGNPDSFKLQVHGDAPAFIEGTDGTITIGAAGVDIWGTTDEFRYVYKALPGDGSIIAKVESLVHANDWTKAGVMIRESISDTSSYAFVCSSSANGTRYQYRLEEFADAAADDALMDGIQQTLPPAPVWLKVERVGSNFNGYYATDENGTNWAPMGENPLAITMISSVYIGLAVTSHDNAVPTTAVFSNVSTTGTGVWEEESFGPTHPDNDPAPMYLRLADTAGNEKVFDHLDPAATNLTAWDEWTIPLTELGAVNPAKIDSITVGVGGSSGTGIIYVDAIRTGKPYPEPAPTE